MVLVSVPKPITLNFRSRPIRMGLRRGGFAEGTGLVVEYHSLHGHYEEISSIIDDAVRRGVALIGTPTALRARLLPKLRLKPSRLYWARPLAPGLVKTRAARAPTRRGSSLARSKPNGLANAAFLEREHAS